MKSEKISSPAKSINNSSTTTEMILVDGGYLIPFFKNSADSVVKVNSFYLDKYAVTNLQFLNFVKNNPSWCKGKVSRLFADEQYLKQWEFDFSIGKDSARIANSPVTNVSWFSANAYAKWVGKRLPTQNEWEWAAQQPMNQLVDSEKLTNYILDWYGKITPEILPNVGTTTETKSGIYDLHGLIWEWVYDFNNQMMNGDSRSGGTLDRNLNCATGSLNSTDKNNYAAFMRYAFRGSLKASYTVPNLGFRCSKNAETKK